MLNLPDITLCSADTAHPVLAARAMTCCLDQCGFADALFLTDADVEVPCRREFISKFSGRADYSAFILNHLCEIIWTDFVLIVQWDGYVVDATCWHDDFLKYDYIGARWPWVTDGTAVGNGGFSLRSRRLLEALASMPAPLSDVEAEDLYICRTMRRELESSHGIRFAPNDIADIFSCEYVSPSRPSFGFHGLMNMYRYVDDQRIERISNMLSESSVTSENFARLMVHYAHQRKFKMLKSLFMRLIEVTGRNDHVDHFDLVLNDRSNAQELMTLCRNSMC